MTSFSIGPRLVGANAPVLIVAELSANHRQRLDVALQSIEAVARAGADAVKLQTYTPDTLTLNSDAPYFVVRTDNEWSGRTLHDLYAEAMTPWEWHAELMQAAHSLGLLCFSTPFDPTALAFLERLGAPCHKVASFELNDLPLVEAIAGTGKPLILSTGMASLEEIEAALGVCRGVGNDALALLRCVSAYPAESAEMNLMSFDVLRELGVVVGLSDHTRDATVAIASVALGAKIIEKHFILDRMLGGPDAFFSLDPSEFRALVEAVRTAEQALGRPRFGPSPGEQANTAFRRSLFVTTAVKKGEVLTVDNVRSIRPAHGLHPRHLPEVLGRVAACDLSAATPLAWDMVGAPRPVAALTLRAATREDAAQLLAWRNDPVTRAMSITTADVTAAEHDAWLEQSLTASDRKLYVADVGGEPVGTARLDADPHGTWAVSLTLAPEQRGMGYAVALLRAVEQAARTLHASRLRAVMRPENAAVLRAFKAAGYYGFVDAEERGVHLLRCERRIVPFGT